MSQLIWPKLQIALCDCHIEFEHNRVDEGSSAQMQLHVRNRGPFPLCGMAVKNGFLKIFDDHADANELRRSSQNIEIALSRVPGFSTNVYCWDFVPKRRGVYPMELPTMSTGFPFGLHEAAKAIRTKEA
ncbi:MAG: hypothetical protein R3C03_23235 [Pirellulaceae bacterium]